MSRLDSNRISKIMILLINFFIVKARILANSSNHSLHILNMAEYACVTGGQGYFRSLSSTILHTNLLLRGELRAKLRGELR